MTPKILEAAERLRRVIDCNTEQLMSLYGVKKWDDALQDLEADRRTISNAYLAEHPAGESEPVTEEWLRSVGFTEELPPPIREDVYDGTMFLIAKIPDREYEGSDDGQYVLIFDDMSGSVWTVSNGQAYGGSTIVRETSTRGDVLRLLKALGIPLITKAE